VKFLALCSFALLLFSLLFFPFPLSPLVTRFIFGTPGCTPTKKPGFLLNLWSTAKDIAKNPVSGHLCVSLVWENRCHFVNAFCRDKSAEIVWFIYGGVGADLGWVPA